jgi:magnesium-transporting ATPase (P-type)
MIWWPVGLATDVLQLPNHWQNLKTHSAGSTKDIKWSNVKVGQVLKVMSDEDIPADLLTLYCHLEDNVCYIKTTNLDGAPESPPCNAAASTCVILVSQHAEPGGAPWYHGKL